MSLLPIIEVPDPLLRAQSAPVESLTDAVARLIADMFETMYEAPGIGLAAVQVAVPRRLLIIDLQDPEEEDGEPVKRPHVFINPEIVEWSDTTKIYNEGCLSIPDQYAEIERPDRVRARWTDEKGKPREGDFDGLMSVCLQHEVDHLNGVLFIDHLSRLKRDMVVRKVVKARRDREKAAIL
ncbi:MAG: peptide deformylase [Sphingomonas sp.]|uniref:peptide deformylase n=1 Tax=Sphingomonas sp. TaxID=28214 RepID=UPI00179F2F06|nr:peptide deformylase [Sphingomonas sp.]MBA3666098.1 peptide deformylase [Sphingomonas sp.]